MKIDRLLAILTILLQNEQVTAPQLAEKLEVYRRTVTQYIDDLGKGIPVVTRQGEGGGISIAPGYKLDKSFLTSGELESVLAGLKGLESVGEESARNLLHKLGGRSAPTGDSVVIDLSTYIRTASCRRFPSSKATSGRAGWWPLTTTPPRGAAGGGRSPVMWCTAGQTGISGPIARRAGGCACSNWLGCGPWRRRGTFSSQGACRRRRIPWTVTPRAHRRWLSDYPRQWSICWWRSTAPTAIPGKGMAACCSSGAMPMRITWSAGLLGFGSRAEVLESSSLCCAVREAVLEMEALYGTP